MVWYMRGISLLLCINSHEPVYALLILLAKSKTMNHTLVEF